MKFKTHQAAFHVGGRPVQIRYVEIGLRAMIKAKRAEDTTSSILEMIYAAGQNDVNPVRNRYSMSPGDVVELPRLFGGGRWRVACAGFERLPDADPILTTQQAEDSHRRIPTLRGARCSWELLPMSEPWRDALSEPWRTWQSHDRVRMVHTTETHRPVPIGTMGTVRRAQYFGEDQGWWLLYVHWDGLTFEQGQGLGVCLLPPDSVTLVERVPWWWRDPENHPDIIQMTLLGFDLFALEDAGCTPENTAAMRAAWEAWSA